MQKAYLVKMHLWLYKAHPHTIPSNTQLPFFFVQMKRSVCIGGGIAIVLLVWIVLVAKSGSGGSSGES